VIRRIGALLAAVMIVASAAASTATSAGAQTATPSFALAAQSSWVAPDGLFVMRFQTANVPPGSQVVLTVHDPVRSRTAFDESASGGTLPPSRCCGSPFPFDALPADPATGQRVLVYPTTSIPDSGVYPLEVDLRNANDESLSHFVTHVVVAPVGADGKLSFGVPLQVAWVWPLRADPAYIVRSPSTVNPSTLSDLQPSGRLGRQAGELAANTDVPLTLAPSPETIDAWSTLSTKFPQLAEGAAAIRAAGLRNQVLTGPFVPLDLPSIFRSDLNDVVSPERIRGASTLETFLGAQLDSSTALPGPLDQQSLQLLQNASVRRLVVEGTALTSANEKFTPAHPYQLETVPGDDSSAVTVAASDPGLEEFLTGNDPPALRAAHLLSGLALIAGEQPSITRGITLINPDRWDADDTFVAAMLAGLRNNPLLRPNTVAGMLTAVPPATVDGEADGAPVYRQLAPYDAPAAPVTPKQYQRAASDRLRLVDLAGATSPQVARADRALASVVSADWQNAAGRIAAGELLDSIRTSLDTVRTQIGAQVRLQQPGTITITSSKAQIPISFQNVSNQTVTVHLKLESDRLLFPNGAEQNVDLPPSRSTTVRVAVETRGSGSSPVQLTVTTANGVPVGSTRITVRSTFVSGVGVFLTVGAIVFLAIWWGWDIHRRRKRRSQSHHPSFPVATPSGQPA
jgi:Family of unknown function (DUF6049)